MTMMMKMKMKMIMMITTITYMERRDPIGIHGIGVGPIRQQHLHHLPVAPHRRLLVTRESGGTVQRKPLQRWALTE
jgi:hypothetical protein